MAIRAGLDAAGEPICIVFGHLGDSNLHLILGSKIPKEFDHEALSTVLYETVQRHQGTVSAEYGIGLTKREQLFRSRSVEALQLVQAMKKMLDPKNILNPNKIFAAETLQAG